ncbi:hypothetical protein TASIC1_0009004500 [Trichoderma asperellum]|uniref:Uncharacterized protein n=1 Tax=Trichoderma asperellum TaxID=101201 RepID=A0A6V8R3Y6_TRIAP|nr:hypothetical protein TASIC1_0009004500 [Trichoderma asperellum]
MAVRSNITAIAPNISRSSTGSGLQLAAAQARGSSPGEAAETAGLGSTSRARSGGLAEGVSALERNPLSDSHRVPSSVGPTHKPAPHHLAQYLSHAALPLPLGPPLALAIASFHCPCPESLPTPQGPGLDVQYTSSDPKSDGLDAKTPGQAKSEAGRNT